MRYRIIYRERPGAPPEILSRRDGSEQCAHNDRDDWTWALRNEGRAGVVSIVDEDERAPAFFRPMKGGRN